MTMKKAALPKVIAIVGPTSSGKTSLSIELARALGGEVVSADSRQVYRGLNIGTGKVTKREMRNIPHHLLDIASPKQVFTASDFVEQGLHAIDDILSRGKVPIIAGGTGFYIDALVGDITLPDVPPNTPLRSQLAKENTSQLFVLLKKLDPKRAETIDRHNPHRLIRAIEIATALGLNPPPKSAPRFDVLWLGIHIPQDILAQKIHDRLIARMRHGMLAEAAHLHRQGLSYKRMNDLGLEYRYLALLLQKNISREEFFVQLERAIVQYAKRQMTWFRRNKKITWVTDHDAVLAQTRDFLSE